MKNPTLSATRAVAGRPRSSALTRQEQLRLAKRAQRARDEKAGQVEVRLKLAKGMAKRLLMAARQPGFITALTKALDETLVEIVRYPQLKLLCWNRRIHYLPAEDAWSLYERNWRFIDPDHLEPAERTLIDALCLRFGPISRG